MPDLDEESKEPDFSFPFESSDSEAEPVECPECGEEFKNSRGKNIHMGQAHK